MFDVFIIFFAGISHDAIRFFSARESACNRPGFGKENRILVGYGPLDLVGVDLFEAFNEVQPVAVFVARRIQPAALIDSDGVDNERVAFPVADRMSHELRIIHDLRGMRPSIHVNHTVYGLILE